MSRPAFGPCRLTLTLGALVGVGLAAACSGEGGLSCRSEGDYVTSRSAPPVRVPDDLSVPDESAALRIPPTGTGAAETPPCLLERPPDYLGRDEPSATDDG